MRESLVRRVSNTPSSEIAAAQQELCRHSWETFVDEPPSIAQGGKGVVVPGCVTCKKRITTVNQFVEHLAKDVLPQILERYDERYA
jgi:hypothetical protein